MHFITFVLDVYSVFAAKAFNFANKNSRFQDINANNATSNTKIATVIRQSPKSVIWPSATPINIDGNEPKKVTVMYLLKRIPTLEEKKQIIPYGIPGKK